MLCGGFANREQMLIRHRIHNGIAPALFSKSHHGLARGGRTLFHGREGHQPHRATRLPPQYAHQICICHRRQRMVFHAAFIQQRIADKKMAEINRTPISRKGRAGKREARSQALQQRIRDGADIALICAVKSRAIFPENLLRTSGEQRITSGQ